MPKTSPQLLLSAAASTLALAALALSAPTLDASSVEAVSPIGAVAGIDLPSAPALPVLLPTS
ncbi:hypothetical protein A6F68_01684 [Tsuneonella dongtanensis]|uniref:Secreted protein n=1 Tax=Tsuneonella dongtanensis TaxID=692370 RepID=A0A1B2ADI7_9SPHN|nr:hypothetical protein [Tsuneonella dongtanensis]ANY20197.1 hypothetical protein A6F68_01684 [Tsuneonella dongtanensis]